MTGLSIFRASWVITLVGGLGALIKGGSSPNSRDDQSCCSEG